MPPDDLPQWIIDARQSIGDRVRVRRIQLGFTQERLCEMTNIGRSTLQRMEAGGESKMSHVLLVAHALRVHVKDLLG